MPQWLRSRLPAGSEDGSCVTWPAAPSWGGGLFLMLTAAGQIEMQWISTYLTELVIIFVVAFFGAWVLGIWIMRQFKKHRD